MEAGIPWYNEGNSEICSYLLGRNNSDAINYTMVDYTSRYDEFYSVWNIVSQNQRLNKIIV
jgi:hypothetical protein